MSNYEVPEPIICSPYQEPDRHYWIEEGEPPELRDGRRKAMYFYREPGSLQNEKGAVRVELRLVNRIRAKMKEWKAADCPGVTRTTAELMAWWTREGRQRRLFFAQVEAAETVIFLTEARADFLQGIEVPREPLSERAKEQGHTGFLRHAAKMATGSGKTTVMGMLAAWSILNKVANRSDARFSDVVLIVCPNVTIRDRLRELDPAGGEASLYRTRDLVPPGALMNDLTQGRVLVRNWHVFEPQQLNPGGVSARVSRAGLPVTVRDTIHIGQKTTTARGSRYLTLEDYHRQRDNGMLEVEEEERDPDGSLRRVKVKLTRYVESDTALLKRVLGREIGGKKNILVMNDEAHHAYRIRQEEPDPEEAEDADEGDEREDFYKEATVWVEGLDRIHKHRSINFCVDLSATPYFLGRVGQQANRPFPWVVSDFGLIDAIESGLVKIPQLAVRDNTGAEIPGYFNIWHWIMQPGRLTASERGGKLANPKPEAILKWAHTPIAMLGSLWDEMRLQWEEDDEPRPPVFILVCKNTALARVIHEWLAEDKCPVGIPSCKITAWRNNGALNTIRVDSKVVHETDSGSAKSDETRWMRHTLDTVGRREWPRDTQDREIFPDGFELSWAEFRHESPVVIRW